MNIQRIVLAIVRFIITLLIVFGPIYLLLAIGDIERGVTPWPF